MRKGGYYVNNTLLGEVDKGTGRRVNKLIAKKDRVTRGRVDELDEWTSEQVDCKGRQSNKGTSGLVRRVDKGTS